MLLNFELKVVTIGQVTDNKKKKNKQKKHRWRVTSETAWDDLAAAACNFGNGARPISEWKRSADKKKDFFFSCNLDCEIRCCFNFVTDRLLVFIFVFRPFFWPFSLFYLSAPRAATSQLQTWRCMSHSLCHSPRKDLFQRRKRQGK